MDNPNLKIRSTFAEVASRRVYRCRVAVHQLPPAEQRHASLNHFAIYLLLGNDESARFDMQPKRDNLGRGRLELSGHHYLMSRDSVDCVDLMVPTCPLEFDPKHANFRSSSSPTVNDFLGHLMAGRLEKYRFLCIYEGFVGCAFWVERVISKWTDDRLVVPSERRFQELRDMMATGYDKRIPNHRAIRFPGMLRFDCAPIRLNEHDVYSILIRKDTSSHVIRALGRALAQTTQPALHDVAERYALLRRDENHQEADRCLRELAQWSVRKQHDTDAASDLFILWLNRPRDVQRLYGALSAVQAMHGAATAVGQVINGNAGGQEQLWALAAVIYLSSGRQ